MDLLQHRFELPAVRPLAGRDDQGQWTAAAVRAQVEEAGHLGYVIRCRQAGEPELKVPLTMMRQSDQRVVIEAIHATVRPGGLRDGTALRAFSKTP